MTKVVNSNIPEVVLEKASIDSFRIYIPLLLIGRENINRVILSHILEVDEETGEQISRKLKKKLVNDEMNTKFNWRSTWSA